MSVLARAVRRISPINCSRLCAMSSAVTWKNRPDERELYMFRIRMRRPCPHDDRHIEMAVFDHRLQRRKRFFVGEIAGGTEKDRLRRRSVLGQSAREYRET